MAEDLVFKVTSSGAGSDLVVATERARRMVREWGMSDRVGPMAWGSQGQVFLGDDLLHTRDYSDDTARVIDEEVQQILTDQEARCRKLLTEHRNALDLIAQSLLEHETISGDEVRRLVRVATDPSAGMETAADSDDASDPTDTNGRSRSTSDGAQAAVSDPASTD
jgi:cell division protease FtsH